MGIWERRKYGPLFVGALLVALVWLGAGCQPAEKRVKVAVVLPLGLDVGQDMLRAAEMALDERGGMAGKVHVEFLVLDSSDPEGSPVSPEMERQAAEKAAADASVVAYLGAPTSDQARASIAVLNQALMVQISPSATWPGLTKPGFGPGEPGVYYPTGRRTFFRVVPSDEVQGAVAARWAEWLGFDTVYVVDDQSAYGQGVAGIFEMNVQDTTTLLVGRDSFAGSRFDGAQVDALVQEITATHPALVFIGSSPGTGGSEFVSALREVDTEVPLMVPDGMLVDELIAQVGADRIGMVWATNVTVPAIELESAAAFRQAYMTAFGKEPQPFAVTTYEATQVLLEAIARAKEPTREGVLDAMSGLGEFEGVLGTWHFDVRGDTSLTTISGMQVRDGQWVFFRVLE